VLVKRKELALQIRFVWSSLRKNCRKKFQLTRRYLSVAEEN
jgi:hypothetical protein